MGTLEITSIALGSPIFGISAFIRSQLMKDPQKLRDLPKQFKELKHESEEINKSPVGLLFDARKNIEEG